MSGEGSRTLLYGIGIGINLAGLAILVVRVSKFGDKLDAIIAAAHDLAEALREVAKAWRSRHPEETRPPAPKAKKT